jgi:hypothetical protein
MKKTFTVFQYWAMSIPKLMNWQRSDFQIFYRHRIQPGNEETIGKHGPEHAPLKPVENSSASVPISIGSRNLFL